MGELINGRCPAEIKSGLRNMLETCADISGIKDTICQKMCCPYDDDNCCHETILMGALALIERLESEHEEFERLEAERDAALAKVPKWISVEERLPQYSTMYLVCHYRGQFKSPVMQVSRFDTNKKEWHGASACSILYGVTHWMEKIELPKEDTHG